MLRKETDSLGMMDLDAKVLHGIHTARAIENFHCAERPVHRDLIQAMITVKKACAMANRDTGSLDNGKADAILKACDQLLAGGYWDVFVTDALQGGAGTSTNMNVNEVIANLALDILGRQKGSYDVIHPLNHVNMSQSTNDVYPTAIRIAAIYKIRDLADALAALQESLQQKENDFSQVLKLGRTQMMDALPITMGQSFGAYARAISRDRWRIYKAEERLREINLGGTAVGTGLNASKAYIYMATDYLQQLTGLGLARTDLLVDTTQNMDVFVEVSGFLKACATNLIKAASDIRLMASGPKGGFSELNLQPLQAGSSIMPGKVNPVICEMTIQAALKTIGNDTTLTQASHMGQLELNPYGPLIADTILESLDLMIRAVRAFDEKCIRTLTVNEEKCLEAVENSSSLAAVFIHLLGYDEAAVIAKASQEANMTIRQYLIDNRFFTEEELDNILNIHQITGPGIATPGSKK